MLRCISFALVLWGTALAAAQQTVLPIIENVQENTPGTQLTISGTGFGTATPSVTMSGQSLSVVTSTDTTVTVALPASFHPGSYLLSVNNSQTHLFGLFAAVVGPVQGPAGPAGPQGVAGAPGLQGVPGSAGPAGPAGPQGPAGAAGATGAQGPAGAAGAIGPQGPVGVAGAVGPAGPIGAVGPQGPIGAVGPQGPVGATGSAGLNGATGAQGVAGPRGLVGAQGAAGPQGPAGHPGPAGPTGPAGADGATGAVGQTGAAGPQLWTAIASFANDLHGSGLFYLPASGTSSSGSGGQNYFRVGMGALPVPKACTVTNVAALLSGASGNGTVSVGLIYQNLNTITEPSCPDKTTSGASPCTGTRGTTYPTGEGIQLGIITSDASTLDNATLATSFTCQ